MAFTTRSSSFSKSSLAHSPSLSCGSYAASLSSLSYSHLNSYSQPSCSPSRQQYPNTRPRSAAFYHRRGPPSTSSPSYRRTHLASLALAPPTGPITYDPFDVDSEPTRRSSTRKVSTQTTQSSPMSSPNRTALASVQAPSYLAAASKAKPREDPVKVRHSKLVAGILLNRINPVGKPMRRTVPQAGPKPYVRSCLSASTTPVECY